MQKLFSAMKYVHQMGILRNWFFFSVIFSVHQGSIRGTFCSVEIYVKLKYVLFVVLSSLQEEKCQQWRGNFMLDASSF